MADAESNYNLIYSNASTHPSAGKALRAWSEANSFPRPVALFNHIDAIDYVR